ncbi:MAG: hypothetical protein ACI8QC_004192 [Planctomycetota bacterium]
MRVAYLEPRQGADGTNAASTAAIVKALEQHVELERFSAPGGEFQDSRTIKPKRFDRILGVFENCGDLVHGMRVMRRLGGVAVLHGWRLDELAREFSPSLNRGGLGGVFAALRHGGMREMLEWRTGSSAELAMNRGVVRWADAFLVEHISLAHKVQDERNTPTAIQMVPVRIDKRSAEALAERWFEALELLPCHRAGAKSLMASAIEGADADRAARAAEEALAEANAKAAEER